MFVPRVLRLKGVRERPPKLPQDAHIDEKISTSLLSRRLGKLTVDPMNAPRRGGPRFTVPDITPEYLGQLLCGVELIFTDFAHQDKDGAGWLEKHYRVVEGEEKCTFAIWACSVIHLSAILGHPNISALKPEANQILLQQAIQKQSTDTLELAKNGYFVRRRPSTYPLRFVPENSFSVVNDDGLRFWDQRTIYVEPHTRYLCRTPAKVAYWLKEHGHLKDKWLPIQAVRTLFDSCAFVVLSGNVMHEGMWQKWRELEKPENWIIMTKVEHTKRTREYIELLKEEKASRKHKGTEATAVDEPKKSTTEQDAESLSATARTPVKNKKRRRSRRKGNKSTNDSGVTNTNPMDDPTGHANAETSDAEAEELDSGQPNKKMRFDD